MKYICLLVTLCLAGASSYAGSDGGFREIPIDEVREAFEGPCRAHPRLFMTDKRLEQIRRQLDSQASLRTFHKAILEKANNIVDDSPVKRVKTGRRLLGVSRECLDRVLHLSAAYRFTGEKRYLRKAEEEMLAAAGFSDWNPSHFLDVAEMTAALAIGYDWLFDDLAASSRAAIRQAIREKGLEPALKQRGWVRGHNNWNQVCNGGITLGVLAIMEHEPELAERLVHRAVNGVQVVMKKYEPDGAYPEGPGYWVYGTSYNVILLAALESVLGTDFGLSEASGFARSASYYLHVTGPTGLYFNYPDSGSRGGLVPAVFWFAQHYDHPALAWNQHQYWKDAAEDNPGALVRSRFAPLVLCWYTSEQTVPEKPAWHGRGSNAVAMFRTSWTDPDAGYLAIKGGSPGVSHGHMDVGSFVFDADGVRWAADLGPESYHKIESLGMNLWGRSQDAERWTILRYNNLSHNTLVVNGKHQRVEGTAPIIGFSDREPFPHVVFDMSSVYEGQLAGCFRRGGLLGDGTAVVQDVFTATAQPATVRWAMVTPAEVSIKDEKTAMLTERGETLRLAVVTDEDVQLKTWSTEPKADYDAQNHGTRLIGFEVALPPGRTARTLVTLTPLPQRGEAGIQIESLLKWSAK